jgi:hypothetical protein
VATYDTWDTDPHTAGQYLALSNGNLTAQCVVSPTGIPSVLAQSWEGKNKGKYYWEVTYNAVNVRGNQFHGQADGVGVVDSFGANNSSGGGFLGGRQTSEPHACGISYQATGGVYATATPVFYNPVYTYDSYGIGDVVCVALDCDNGLVWFRKNGGHWVGTDNTTADPASGTAGIKADSSSSSPWANQSPGNPQKGLFFPAINLCGHLGQFTANFGATAFAQAVPSGFTSGWTLTVDATQFGSWATECFGTSGGGGHFPGTTGNTVIVSRFIASTGGQLASMAIPLVTGNTTGFVAVVFADSSGTPGSWIATSSSPPTPIGTDAIWVFPFTNGPVLTNGVAYWLGLLADSNGFVWSMISDTGVTGLYALSSTYPTVPASMASGTPYSTRLPMYAIFNLAPPTGTLAITGIAPTLAPSNSLIIAGTGTLAITGIAPRLPNTRRRPTSVRII